MRKYKAFMMLFILVAGLLLGMNMTITVSAASNPYPEEHTIMGFPLVNCTWYAWQQVYDNTGIALPNFGNAINWYTGAQNHGYATGTVAKANSVAVWRTSNGYGHVGWVVSVSGSKMKVNEGGMTNATGTAAANGTGIVTGESYNSTVGEAKFSGSSTILVGFIYPTEEVTTNVTVLPTQSGKTNTATNNNATVYGSVNKTSSAAVQKLGIRVAKQGSDYSTGKTYKYTPNGGTYTGNTYIGLTFDIKDEVGYALTHATTYKYQIYAQVEGKDYWSEEKTFTTTGSHSYGSWSTVTKETCTTAGSQKRSCACGAVETKKIAATGHGYSSSFTVDKNPTCTAAGSKSRHCTKCSATTEVTAIAAKGHSYTDWTITSQPNCTQAGSKKRSCACGHTEYGTIAALGHSYSSAWTTEQQATCTASGVKSHRCTRCSAKASVTTIPATGHSFGSWTTEQQATTAADGKEVRICGNTGCGKKEIRTIPKLPSSGHSHSFGPWQERTKASCTEEGVTVSVCTSCNAEQTKTVAAIGHQFGAWSAEQEADCVHEGVMTSVCALCNEKQTQTTAALGHDWQPAEDGTEAIACSRCGAAKQSAEDAEEQMPATTQPEETEPVQTEPAPAPETDPSAPQISIVVAVAVCSAFAVLGGGAAAYFFIKAKKLGKVK